MSAYSFGVTPITCHAWNGKGDEIAISKNDHNIEIYKKTSGDYNQTATLSEHGQRVTGIDWEPQHNRIVTSGADRNAYVWEFQGGAWKPCLVILRINRAASCVKWSPNGDKFAVGSGSRLVSICYFEEENHWWVSKHIKKPIRSTVTCLDWHPNNVLIAAGSSDFKARIFSAYIKEIENKPTSTCWGAKMPFANCMFEVSNGGGGWVQDVSFSASGELLAFVGHDSSISVVNGVNNQQLAVLKGAFLPMLSLTWIGPHSIVAAGHDCVPKLFRYSDDGNVTFVSDLDIAQEKETGTMSAMNRFRNLDKKASADSSTELKTKHQNTITQVSIYSGTKDNCSKFCTTGKDGQMIIWDVKSLESSISGLKIS